MQPNQEIEVKLEVRDPRAVRRRLRELRFRRVKARSFESNRLFDFPDGPLRRAQRLLRLRFTGGKALLTFKGAPARSSRYKVRTEIETEVKDGRRLERILESAGLRVFFRYDKYRTTYTESKNVGRGAVVFDETPIGDYLELEGPRRWIDQVARLLGYGPRDYITLSYMALYYQKSLAAGRKPANMVFPARRRAGASSTGLPSSLSQ